MVKHVKALASVVEAVKNLLPDKAVGTKVLREIEAIEKRDAAQQSSTVIEDTEPSE